MEKNPVDVVRKRGLDCGHDGIDFAHRDHVLHLGDLGPDTPRLPKPPLAALSQLAVSAIAHGAAALAIIFVLKPAFGVHPAHAISEQQAADVRHMVFLAIDPRPVGTGGGGGGNRRAEPIRHAEGVGTDAITLRVKTPAPAAAPALTNPLPTVPEDLLPLPSVVLDMQPLASGTFDQIGLPSGGVSDGASTGPGSGGGVGTGVGTGIGPGQGPGLGPGSGGGSGGGVFRPGGAVTAPRLIAEVKAAYTSDALAHRVQGTVVLEAVVTRDGRPTQIRLVRSLDPGGLDERAVAAVAQWRFEPGHLAGAPVDVLVTIMLDFWIR